jgi:hypothetical protein
VQQGVDTRPGGGRPEEHRIGQRVLDLRGQLLAQPAIGDRRAAVQEGGENRVVALGQRFGEPRPDRRGGAVVRDERGVARAEPADRAHRDDRGGQPFGDLAERAVVARAAAVDLVDEEQRRDAQPPQGTPQDPCLRLDALDRRDHEHDAVQHAQRALHLGDEVRVAGRVDHVDGGAADRERDDRRLDRDPALALERQRVRLRRPRIDAAGFVDDPGAVQEPLGQRCLAGVNMCEDPEIENSARHAPHPPNRPTEAFRWTRTLLASRLLSDSEDRAARADPLREEV